MMFLLFLVMAFFLAAMIMFLFPDLSSDTISLLM